MLFDSGVQLILLTGEVHNLAIHYLKKYKIEYVNNISIDDIKEISLIINQRIIFELEESLIKPVKIDQFEYKDGWSILNQEKDVTQYYLTNRFIIH